jgi:hypothetical protein
LQQLIDALLIQPNTWQLLNNLGARDHFLAHLMVTGQQRENQLGLGAAFIPQLLQMAVIFRIIWASVWRTSAG